MKRLMTLLSMSCLSCTHVQSQVRDNQEKDVSAVYSYDPTTGKCLNAAGEEGYNVFDEQRREEMIQSKNAECFDLSERLMEGNWVAVSFRGANLYKTGFQPYGSLRPD